MNDMPQDLPGSEGGVRPEEGIGPEGGDRPEPRIDGRTATPSRGEADRHTGESRSAGESRSGNIRPDWLLERIALDEVASHLAPRAEERGRNAEDLESGLVRLRADDAEILARRPPAAFAEEVRRLAAAEERAGRAQAPAPPLFARLRLAAAACAALLVAVVTLQLRPGGGPQLSGTERLKGALVVSLFRKQGDSALALRSGDTARAGDLLQIRYRAPRALHGVVLSIDGRGAVTLHLPESGTRAAALEPGAAVALDQSYQLDDAPAFERFVLVASPDTFSVELVAAAARRLAASGQAGSARLDLPPRFEQADFLLLKPASSGTAP